MLRRAVGFSLVLAGNFLAAAHSQAADTAAARRPAWTTSKIHGTPEPPEPYRIVPAFPQVRFQLPTSIEEIPGANRLLVTEMGGKIFTLPKDPAATQADLVVDLTAELKDDAAGKRVSLFDAELHPKFAENRFVFVCYVYPGGSGITRLSRLTLTRDEKPALVPDSELVILTWPSGGHNAGCLEFGKEGYLYVATGDGSGPNPPDGRTTGQDVSDLLGAVLRINVDETSLDKNYAVPMNNPFAQTPRVGRSEIWSYGLRNPWKFGIDPQTGDVFVADNGWESWEMIHKLSRGSNCGWPIMEGRASLRSEVTPGPTPIVPPIKDHSHTEANSVIGGPVYRGSKLPELNGSFVYGDYITGTIWAVKPDQDNSFSCTTLADTDLRIVAFLEGSRGELYVLDYDFTGQIYELQPSGLKDTSASFPRKLSATGLFKSLKTLEPADGVVPYEVQVERWMDGAKAQRWVAVPGNATIDLAASPVETSVFPEGTVFVKQINLTAKADGSEVRVETQLLHYEYGVWHPYSYLWNEAGDDATLVDSIGAARPHVPKSDGGMDDRTWHVNAVNECKLCHNAGPKFVLGFVANQLDRVLERGRSDSPRQTSHLAELGVIKQAVTVADSDPFRLIDPHDGEHSLDDRARSYLHANCSMCHHPGGNAIVSFYLRRDLPFDKLNTNKGTGIGTFGLEDAKIIVPGAPERSVLMYRMSKLGYARMPYIGSRWVDSFGVQLTSRWIESLAGSPPKQNDPLGPLEDLTKSTGKALRWAKLLHTERVRHGTPQAAAKIASAAPADIRGLFDTFLPESQRRATLGPTFDPQVVLSKQGDLERGKLIFFSDGARCRNCHELDDKQKSLGPTLREVVKKHPQSADMLQHILQPSLKIEEPFAAFAVVTDDGRVLAGLIIEQNDKEVTLKTPDKQVIKLSRSNIEELRKSDKSLMPDRILSDLTAQEAADLLAYIRTQAETK